MAARGEFRDNVRLGMTHVPRANPSGVSHTLAAIDLFSGCGGMTEGLKAAGFSIMAAVDNDSTANESYAANHPEVPLFAEDIGRIKPHEFRITLRLRKGQLDLLAGCPPCQGFSSLRTLNGMRSVHDHGKRLIHRFSSFAVEFMPKVILFENVPGLASDHRFGSLVRVLKSLGYQYSYATLDAADYGVPQRRRRLLLLASRVGELAFAHPTPRTHTVRTAIGSLPRAGSSGDPLHDVLATYGAKVSGMISRVPRNGGSRSALGRRSQLRCHKNTNGFTDVYGRMAWDDVAPTITGGCINPSKGRFLHPTADRAITLREAALLQSFPPGYYISLSRGKYIAAKLIGNALPPEFIRHHARQVARLLACAAGGD